MSAAAGGEAVSPDGDTVRARSVSAAPGSDPRRPLADPTAARLTVRTVALEGAHDLGTEAGAGLLDLLAGADDVVSWVRHGRGFVGWGRVLTLDARGEERVAHLRHAWRGVVGAARWTDEVRRPGSGPVALGTVTFSPDSAASSMLVVPEVLVGRDEQGWWLTTTALAGDRMPDLGQVRAQVTARLAERSGQASTTERTRPVSTVGPEAAGPDAADRGTVEPGALSPAEFEAAVAHVAGLLRTGEAQKVVLARDVVVHRSRPLTRGDLVARLGADYPSCWAFAVDSLVGATPELLVRLDGRRLASRVLAGTARRRPGMEGAEVDALAAWLEASPKNRREHALARESAVAALEPLCAEVSAPSQPAVLRLPNVLHLASDLTGLTAGDTGVLSLVAALHPTAAVCGTPTVVAAAVIAQVEAMDRGRYTGPVGWVDWQGGGEWCIALRCGQELGDGGWRVFGGGGIMPDSDPADELAETAAKMRPMLTALTAEIGTVGA